MHSPLDVRPFAKQPINEFGKTDESKQNENANRKKKQKYKSEN